MNPCISMYVHMYSYHIVCHFEKKNFFHHPNIHPHTPPHLNPKNTSFIHSPKPTRYKTFCNLIALSHETAASEKVALHEHENRCEGEWMEKRERERRRREKNFHEMMIIPENIFIHRGMFLYVWVDG